MLWSEIPTQGLREGRSAYGDVEQWRAQSKTLRRHGCLRFREADAHQRRAGRNKSALHRVSSELSSRCSVCSPRTGARSRRRRPQRAAAARGHQSRLLADPFRRVARRDRRDARARSDAVAHHRHPSAGRFTFDVDDVWEPHTLFAELGQLRVARGTGSWSVVARLRPGRDLRTGAGRDERDRATSRRTVSGGAAQRGISVVPLSLHVTGSATRLALWMLTGAVSFVLLMAIANIAGLSLARSAGREREIAIRSALGASQAHIVRQLIIESVTLAVVSGIASLLVALAGIRLILSLRPGGLARLDEVGLDPSAFGWALALSLLSGVLIGLAPAITTLRRNLKPAFQEGGRGASGGAAARRIRRVLVVGGICAGDHAAGRRRPADPQPAECAERRSWIQHRAACCRCSSPARCFRTMAQRVNYFERVLEQARAVAGVERAAIASEFFIGGNPEQTVTRRGQHASRVGARAVSARRDQRQSFSKPSARRCSEGGRFTAADGANAPKVAIINDMMARRLWPGQDAVGRRFKFGPPDSNRPLVYRRRQSSATCAGRDRNTSPFRRCSSRSRRIRRGSSTLLVRTSTDPVQHDGQRCRLPPVRSRRTRPCTA